MRSPAFSPPCKACGRDLVNARCSFCDAEVAEPETIAPSRRVYRAIELNPGRTAQEICQYLGVPDGAENDVEVRRLRDNVASLISRMAKLGAIRYEGKRCERIYYVVDASKLPRSYQDRVDTSAAKRKRSRARRRYHRLLDQGLCVCCGGSREGGGKALCPTCLGKKSARARARVSNKSLCSECGCSMLPEWKPFRMCPQCRERNRENRRTWRANPDVKDRLNAKQRVYDRIKKERLRAAGLCDVCEQPCEKSRCAECYRLGYAAYREHILARRRERVEAGLCAECGAVAEAGRSRCARHLELMRKVAQRRRDRLKQMEVAA